MASPSGIVHSFISLVVSSFQQLQLQENTSDGESFMVLHLFHWLAV